MFKDEIRFAVDHRDRSTSKSMALAFRLRFHEVHVTHP